VIRCKISDALDAVSFSQDPPILRLLYSSLLLNLLLQNWDTVLQIFNLITFSLLYVCKLYEKYKSLFNISVIEVLIESYLY